MFQTPDIGTLRLCSFLLSMAFFAAFTALWSGRRDERHLLFWGGSLFIYSVVLVGLGMFPGRPQPLPGVLAFVGVATSNMLLLAGIRSFENRPPFRPWMFAAVLAAGLGYLLPIWLDRAGLFSPVEPSLGGTLGLAAGVAVFGSVMLLDGPGTAPGGRRIAALALLGFLPGYAAVIATALHWPDPFGIASMLPMVADQVLLPVLYLGLLAMPGERAQQVLRDAALRDPMTGAWNRAGFEARQAEAARRGAALLLLLDIDHFKAINDRHGHAAGDAVLRAFTRRAAMLAEEQHGWQARLGGDEFAVVMPGATAGAAEDLAERVRHAAASGSVGVPDHTVSVGLGLTEPGETGLSDAMARADASMYRAKRLGRNQVVAA
jgi:diguanylate cyclase (GGDEF)-like protein